MKVLITGASGLIGRRLVQRLAPVHEVVVLARRDPQAELPDGVTWVRQDLVEPLDLERLPARLDGIVHLAQSTRYRDFPEGAEDVFEVNVHSTFRLLEHAMRTGTRAFVLASTGGCYSPSQAPIGEDAPLAPPGPYFRSKRMAELLVENYGDQIGGAVLRFFFVYGPGQRQGMLVARLAERILGGEEIVIEGDPGMGMNPVYVDDAAAAVEAALGLDRQTIVNVAGDEVVSLTDLVERLANALGRKPTVRHSDASPGDLVADTSRMNEVLGTVAEVPLDQGLSAVARSLASGSGLRGSDVA